MMDLKLQKEGILIANFPSWNFNHIYTKFIHKDMIYFPKFKYNCKTQSICFLRLIYNIYKLQNTKKYLTLNGSGFKTPLAALGSLSPQMAITTIAFSLVFEPSWNIIKMHEVFASWQNMMYALGRIFVLCILSTLEVNNNHQFTYNLLTF